MHANHTLWNSLRLAVDALKASLTEANMTHPHVSDFPPGKREETRRVLEDRKELLLMDLGALQSVETELAVLHNSLVQRVARVQNSLSPIASLPNETLRQIFDYITGPQSPRQTLQLSSVCKHWRELVHGHRVLWSEVNWDQWDRSLLELWCKRAAGHPLRLILGPPGVSMLSRYAKDFKVTKNTWNVLQVYDRTTSSTISLSPDPVRNLLEGNLPSLEMMVYFSLSSGTLVTQQEAIKLSAPNLEILGWRGPFSLSISGPLPKLRSVFIDVASWSQWPSWLSVLKASPVLASMHVKLGELAFGSNPPSELGHSGRVVLPSLISLTAQCFSPVGLIHCFRHASIPQARHIILNSYLASTQTHYTESLLFLTRIAPSATHLTFDDTTPPHWPTGRFEDLLKSLTAQYTAIPFLTVTRIVYSGALPAAQMDSDVIGAFIAARGVRRLTLPAGWELSAEALMEEFDYLKVDVTGNEFLAFCDTIQHEEGRTTYSQPSTAS